MLSSSGNERKEVNSTSPTVDGKGTPEEVPYFLDNIKRNMFVSSANIVFFYKCAKQLIVLALVVSKKGPPVSGRAFLERVILGVCCRELLSLQRV